MSTDAVKSTMASYSPPSHEDVERIVMQARAMRARALNGMLKAIVEKLTPSKPEVTQGHGLPAAG